MQFYNTCTFQSYMWLYKNYVWQNNKISFATFIYNFITGVRTYGNWHNNKKYNTFIMTRSNRSQRCITYRSTNGRSCWKKPSFFRNWMCLKTKRLNLATKTTTTTPWWRKSVQQTILSRPRPIKASSKCWPISAPGI